MRWIVRARIRTPNQVRWIAQHTGNYRALAPEPVDSSDVPEEHEDAAGVQLTAEGANHIEALQEREYAAAQPAEEDVLLNVAPEGVRRKNVRKDFPHHRLKVRYLGGRHAVH